MKPQIIEAIRAHILSRPNLDPRDYGRDAAAYRADQRTTLTDRAHALKLLAAVESRDSITAAMMLDPYRNTGRFTIKQDGQTIRADYCTGQYWATEYRAGAARYLANLLWDYLREQCNATTGDQIRKQARLMLGAPLARRFFN